MTTRRNRVTEAERRARRQLTEALNDAHERRIAGGYRQSDISRLLGCSHQWISAMERVAVDDLGVIELSRFAAAVGLDVSIRTHPAESVLRDAGQVKILARLRDAIDPNMPIRLEPQVAPGDPRAFDAVLGSWPQVAAVEVVSRLRDVQAQIRPLLAKQADGRIPVLLLVIGATVANRRAVREATTVLTAAFPLGTRAVMASLRRGRIPTANGIALI